MKRTKKPFDATLPATPCTKEMRNSMFDLATDQGKSLAELQRMAFALFLSQYDSNTITQNSTTLQGCA